MRNLPNSLEAEQAVLACIMLDDRKYLLVRAILQQQDFYYPANQMLYKAIQELEQTGQPIDVVSVVGKLSDDELSKCGGIEYVSTLVDIIPSTEHIQHYAEIVKADSQRRQLIALCQKAVADLYDTDSDYNDVINSINAARISTLGLKQTHYSEIRDKVDEKIRNGHKCGFLTGLTQIDDVLLGFQPGLYTIAGRSSMGKSEISRFLAYSLAKKGARVWFHTLEDSVELTAKKLIAFLAGADVWKLQKGWIGQGIINEAHDLLSSLPIYFNDTPFTVNQLRAEIEVRRKDFDVLFVDQLSYIKSNQKEMRLRFDENIRGLFQIAKELEMPVIVMAQINRGVEQRNDKHPLMSDLKESGSIEETSDAVMLLYREGYYDKNADQDTIEINIAKNKITDRKGTIALQRVDGDFIPVVGRD